MIYFKYVLVKQSVDIKEETAACLLYKDLPVITTLNHDLIGAQAGSTDVTRTALISNIGINNIGSAGSTGFVQQVMLS